METSYYHKILSNSASEDEKREFFKSLEKDSELKEEFIAYRNLYVVSNLNHKINPVLKNQSFKKFWHQTQLNKNHQLIYQWTKYAAVFLVALLFGFMVDYFVVPKENVTLSHSIRYSSEHGSVSNIHLEDGSTIWLSSGTNLEINKNSNGEMLATLDGEAFFDMIPDPTRKFEVDLGKFKVRDIGTKFNIRAYKEERLITTALMNGQVELFGNSEKLLSLDKPGESFTYDKSSNKIIVGRQDLSFISAWKDGKFVFVDKTLSEICKELENWYDIKIYIEDQNLAKARYTSVIKRSTTVKMVLEILAITDQIKYEITDMKEGQDIIRIKK